MEKVVEKVRMLDDKEFLDFSKNVDANSCKETCSFLVNNLFRCNNTNLYDNDNNNHSDRKCNNTFKFQSTITTHNKITLTTTTTQAVVANSNKPAISRSTTFSTPPKQSVAILTPNSTKTALLTDKKAAYFLGSSAPATLPLPQTAQTTPPITILSTSPEVFHLLSTPSTKTELIFQGDLLLCRIGGQKTVLKRLVSSTCLRKWEKHKLILDNCDIHSTTAYGSMDNSINYQEIKEIIMLPRLQQTNKFCIQLVLENSNSLVLQTPNLMQRDQWFYSIQWRTAMMKFDGILRSLSPTSEIPVQPFMDLISVALKSAIKDSSIQHYPLHALSFLLSQHQEEAVSRRKLSAHLELGRHISQLLDTTALSKEMCDFYNKHKTVPCYREIILVLFKPVVLHVLKHNVNFGKNSRQFLFVQDYFVTVGKEFEEINDFIKSIHGELMSCPHLNILPNLMSLCLSSLHNSYEVKKRFSSVACGALNTRHDERLTIFFAVLQSMASFQDWRLSVSQLLHSVPFGDESLEDEGYFKKLTPTLRMIAEDDRCDVHTRVLRVRNRVNGWMDIVCPGNKSCFDDGQLYSTMLDQLVKCCCKRKSFVQSHMKMLEAWKKLSCMGTESAIELLILSLEYNLLESESETVDVTAVLSASQRGRESLETLQRRQSELKELQKEGPLTLTLPARSTDADLSRTLSTGPFGNVESLSLAFTMVTSACAIDLIKLPSLKYLNLWSTKFGDEGLEIICEHMHRLQVLNLCETPVTDKGLKYLTALKNLQKLNLNSTHLSAVTFEALKEKLPSLQEFDVCYTDAW